MQGIISKVGRHDGGLCGNGGAQWRSAVEDHKLCGLGCLMLFGHMSFCQN